MKNLAWAVTELEIERLDLIEGCRKVARGLRPSVSDADMVRSFIDYDQFSESTWHPQGEGTDSRCEEQRQ